MITRLTVFLLLLFTPRPRRTGDDAGMATAEYAIMTVVACAFAVVMFGVIRGGTVRDLLTGMIRRALTLPA